MINKASARYLTYISSLLVCLLISACPALANTYTVDPDGTCDFTTIQAAINNADANDVIIVTPAIYAENINTLGKAITLQSTDPTNPAIVAITTINGVGIGTVITFDNEETSSTVVNGFTIKHGYADYGGGIFCDVNASPQIANCNILDNEATSYGGGLYCSTNSNPAIIDCSFSDNTAVVGGAVRCGQASPTFTGCSISSNTAQTAGAISITHYSQPLLINCYLNENIASASGGAIVCYDHSDLKLAGCTIMANSAQSGSAGAIYLDDSSLFMTNCCVTGNEADLIGGGICSYDSNLTITNCLMNYNTAANAGAIYLRNGSANITGSTSGYNVGLGQSLYCYNTDAIVTNCILWGLSATQIYTQLGDTPQVTYTCLVQSSITGEGNVSSNPAFIEPLGVDGVGGTADDNFRLLSASPCIDAGSNQYITYDALDLNSNGSTDEVSPYDLDYNPRFADVLEVADTGVQHFPVPTRRVVDMGAYEYIGSAPVTGDLDSDGDVDVLDFAIFAQNWLTGT